MVDDVGDDVIMNKASVLTARAADQGFLWQNGENLDSTGFSQTFPFSKFENGFLQTAINIFDQTCLNCRKYDENLIFSPNLFSRPSSDWKQNEEKIEFVFYVASPVLSGVVESSDLHNCPNTLAQTCSMLIDVTTRKFFIDTSQNDSCIPDICRKRREP